MLNEHTHISSILSTLLSVSFPLLASSPSWRIIPEFFFNHIFLFKSCHSGPVNKRQTIIISGDLGTDYMNITQKIWHFFYTNNSNINNHNRRKNSVSQQSYFSRLWTTTRSKQYKNVNKDPNTCYWSSNNSSSNIQNCYLTPCFYIQHAGRAIRTIKTRKGERLLHAPVKRVKAQWGVFHSDVRSACERSQVPPLLLQQRALHWACSNTAGWHGNNRNTRLSKRTSEPHLPSLSSPPAIPWGHSMFLSL